jgi:hypothetical protein
MKKFEIEVAYARMILMGSTYITSVRQTQKEEIT